MYHNYAVERWFRFIFDNVNKTNISLDDLHIIKYLRLKVQNYTFMKMPQPFLISRFYKISLHFIPYLQRDFYSSRHDSLNKFWMRFRFTFSLPSGVRCWLRRLLVALPGLFCLPFISNMHLFFSVFLFGENHLLIINMYGHVWYILNDTCTKWISV